MYPIALGLVIRNNALWAEINAALRELPFRVVLDHPEIEDQAELLARIERMVPDVLLVEFTGSIEVLEKLVPLIKATAAAPIVVALQASREVEGVVAALRAGVDQFLFPPFREKLGRALERAQHRVRQRPSGKVFGFLSVKGGCGATTVACHTALAIARHAADQHRRALLIDLDLNTGMVRFLMRAESPYSVLDAVSNLQRLDFDYWEKLVSGGGPGLEIMAAPEELTSKHELKREQVQHVLSFARTHYDWTLLDLGRGLGLLVKSVLREIDELYLVTTHEIPAVHLTKKIIEALGRCDYPAERVRLLANRIQAKSDLEQLEQVLGVPAFASLPADFAALFQAYSSGQLLGRRTRLGREFERLGDRIVGAPRPAHSMLEWVGKFGRLGGEARESEEHAGVTNGRAGS